MSDPIIGLYFCPACNKELGTSITSCICGWPTMHKETKNINISLETYMYLQSENTRLHEQLKASRSAYEKLSKLFNELEKSQNEACKQLREYRQGIANILGAIDNNELQFGDVHMWLLGLQSRIKEMEGEQ